MKVRGKLETVISVSFLKKSVEISERGVFACEGGVYTCVWVKTENLKALLSVQ